MTNELLDAVLIGSDAVDPETGEILVFPEGCKDGPERIAWLTHMHREADREVKAWEVEKGKWARFLARAVAEAGMKSFKSDYGSVVSVAATTTRPRIDVLLRQSFRVARQEKGKPDENDACKSPTGSVDESA